MTDNSSAIESPEDVFPTIVGETSEGSLTAKDVMEIIEKGVFINQPLHIKPIQKLELGKQSRMKMEM